MNQSPFVMVFSLKRSVGDSKIATRLKIMSGAFLSVLFKVHAFVY